LESRTSSSESGWNGLIEQDAEQLRKVRSFMPESLYRLVRRANTSVLAQQRVRAVGDTALTGTATKQEVSNPHQIWEGFEYPTDNWF
jgi:hypothetical protein